MLRKKIIWVSATKSWEKSRIFRYGLPKDFLVKGKKPQEGGGAYSAPPPWLRGYVRKTNIYSVGPNNFQKIQRRFICLFYYSNVIFNKSKFLKIVCSPHPWFFFYLGKVGHFASLLYANLLRFFAWLKKTKLRN